MTASIDIAEEVRAHLTPSDLAWIRNLCESRLCRACGLPVHVGTEDSAVVLDVFLDETSVGFVHRTCAASQVRYTGTEAPEREEDASVLTMLQPHATGLRPVLLFVSDAKMVTLSESGEAYHGIMQLLSCGWTLLRTVGKTPELLSDWKLTLDPYNERGAITTDEGISFLDDLPSDLPPGWIETIVLTRELTILSGTFDMDSVKAAENPLKVLNEYAHRGALIGARVPVQFAHIPTDPVQAAGRRLADDLHTAITTVASSDGIRKDALVQLEPTVEFKPVRTDTGQPMLFVDLQDGDQERVAAVLDELRGLGFPSGTAPDIKHHFLPNAPHGWGCVVWLSQIRIFIKSASDSPRQLWFASFTYTDQAWYRDVRKAQAIGVIVGNKFPTSIDPFDLINDLRRGHILGVGVPAMCVS